MSLTQKSRNKIKIQKSGSLTKLGYKLKSPVLKRRRSLDRAVSKYGYKSTMAKVNALYVFNKNRNKTLARKAEIDKDYLRRKFRVQFAMFNKPRRSRKKPTRCCRRPVRRSR